MRRSLHALLLVFAFLFAQVGMAAHAASHAASPAQAGDEGAPSDAACELCVGYAQLGGAAPPATPPALPACLARHEAPATFAPVFISRSAFDARARAPPVFS